MNAYQLVGRIEGSLPSSFTVVATGPRSISVTDPDGFWVRVDGEAEALTSVIEDMVSEHTTEPFTLADAIR